MTTCCRPRSQEFEPDEELRCLPCNHAFHAECISDWFKCKHTCPHCVRAGASSRDGVGTKEPPRAIDKTPMDNLLDVWAAENGNRNQHRVGSDGHVVVVARKVYASDDGQNTYRNAAAVGTQPPQTSHEGADAVRPRRVLLCNALCILLPCCRLMSACGKPQWAVGDSLGVSQRKADSEPNGPRRQYFSEARFWCCCCFLAEHARISMTLYAARRGILKLLFSLSTLWRRPRGRPRWRLRRPRRRPRRRPGLASRRFAGTQYSGQQLSLSLSLSVYLSVCLSV